MSDNSRAGAGRPGRYGSGPTMPVRVPVDKVEQVRAWLRGEAVDLAQVPELVEQVAVDLAAVRGLLADVVGAGEAGRVVRATPRAGRGRDGHDRPGSGYPADRRARRRCWTCGQRRTGNDSEPTSVPRHSAAADRSQAGVRRRRK